MQSLLDKVYIVSNNFRVIDLKYSIENVMDDNVEYLFRNSKYLIYYSSSGYMVCNGITIRKIVPLIGKGWHYHGFFGNQIVEFFRFQNKEYEAHLYNIETGELTVKTVSEIPPFIKKSPNERKILVSNNGCYAIINQKCCLNDLLDNTIVIQYSRYIGHGLCWRNNHQLAYFDRYYQRNLLISRIVFYDLDFKIKAIVDLFEHKMTTDNFVFCNDIYIWNKNVVLIIDVQNKLTKINNTIGVMTYNMYHNAFVTNKLKLYQIRNNVFVKYVIKYNFWQDIPLMPFAIYDLFEVLLELELFPNEIINEIYRLYCKQKIEI